MSKFAGLSTYPEHVRVLQVGLGVPLLSVDEVRELGRVSDEENGSVVEHPVPVTLFGPELDSKATRIASGVGRSRLASDSREADSRTNFLPNLTEKRLGGDVTQVVGHFEVTMGAGAFSVDLRGNID